MFHWSLDDVHGARKVNMFMTIKMITNYCCQGKSELFEALLFRASISHSTEIGIIEKFLRFEHGINVVQVLVASHMYII